jgi:hypothetical protein
VQNVRRQRNTSSGGTVLSLTHSPETTGNTHGTPPIEYSFWFQGIPDDAKSGFTTIAAKGVPRESISMRRRLDRQSDVVSKPSKGDPKASNAWSSVETKAPHPPKGGMQTSTPSSYMTQTTKPPTSAPHNRPHAQNTTQGTPTASPHNNHGNSTITSDPSGLPSNHSAHSGADHSMANHTGNNSRPIDNTAPRTPATLSNSSNPSGAGFEKETFRDSKNLFPVFLVGIAILIASILAYFVLAYIARKRRRRSLEREVQNTLAEAAKNNNLVLKHTRYNDLVKKEEIYQHDDSDVQSVSDSDATCTLSYSNNSFADSLAMIVDGLDDRHREFKSPPRAPSGSNENSILRAHSGWRSGLFVYSSGDEDSCNSETLRAQIETDPENQQVDDTKNSTNDYGGAVRAANCTCQLTPLPVPYVNQGAQTFLCLKTVARRKAERDRQVSKSLRQASLTGKFRLFKAWTLFAAFMLTFSFCI